ncbi:TMEM56 [Branchiostoma lanceolatum]|uniref:TMEM56 protein n=1 Tax=Branchiostoma lanceolatum TaxID=7740 RepID=A0A8J9W272_BRALA|nr:TMEM56 [Branchiostoma lanceolatum]
MIDYNMKIFAGVFFHLAVFKWLSSPLLKKVSPVFATLPPNEQVALRKRVMSFFNAVATGGCGLYVLLWPDGVLPNQIWFDSAIVRHAGCITLSYLVAGLLLMAVYPSVIKDKLMVVHHFNAIPAIYICTAYPFVPYYANLWALMELSSPFLHIRMISISLGQKRSLLYKLSSALLLVTFFACRVAPIPLWFQLAEPMANRELYNDTPIILLTSIFIMTPMAYLFNIYWFSKLCRGAYYLLYHHQE